MTPLKDFYKQNDKALDRSRDEEDLPTMEQLVDMPTEPNIKVGKLGDLTDRSGVASGKSTSRVNFNVDDNFENAAQLDAPPARLDSAPDKDDNFQQESEVKEEKEIPKIPNYIFLEFHERSRWNKVGRFVYIIFKTF